jgi:hypothetical protein
MIATNAAASCGQTSGWSEFRQAQVLGQPRGGHAGWGARDVLRRSRRDDVPAVRAASAFGRGRPALLVVPGEGTSCCECSVEDVGLAGGEACFV